jgi:hypothetical protein
MQFNARVLIMKTISNIVVVVECTATDGSTATTPLVNCHEDRPMDQEHTIQWVNPTDAD